MPVAKLARRICASSRREMRRGDCMSFCRTRISLVVGTFVAPTLQARDVTIRRVPKGMLDMQSKNKPEYDVIVVVSGASGGWACKRLAEAGLQIEIQESCCRDCAQDATGAICFLGMQRVQLRLVCE